jgi:Raf kinase inhibitor-like YbhB/YbcL family protein
LFAGLVLGLALSILIGCDSKRDAPINAGATPDSTNSNNSPGDRDMNVTITFTSSPFKAGESIPKKYTGEGEDVSPPLAWSSVPHGARELALICDDPDAPNGTWVHWVIYKIPATTKSLPEGIPREPTPPTPAGALQGTNSWDSDNIGYRGPMPPPGHGVHHYHFKLYALDKPLDLKPGIDKKSLLAAMQGHIIGQGEIVGTYERKTM